VLIVKHWAIVAQINDAMDGTINRCARAHGSTHVHSYSLMLLVIHYLQCAVQPPVLPSLQALYPHVFTNQRAPNELWLNEQMNLPPVDWAAGRWGCGWSVLGN